MANTINKFINGFNGGTRLNRFTVSDTKSLYTTPYHIRSAEIPGAYISSMGLNYFGRTIELPGERTYQPWRITVLDDTGDQELYSFYEEWQHSIGNKDINTFVNINNAFSNTHFTVSQYKTDSDDIEKQFKLFNVWPISIGPLELDMSKDNQLCQFTVTLHYTHFDYTG